MFVYFYTFSFFFFKQKTAYEMRISDWSSDVCSSDLLDKVINGYHIPAAACVSEHSVEFRQKDTAGVEVLHVQYMADFGSFRDNVGNLLPVPACPNLQIGRESCRERVCKYV